MKFCKGDGHRLELSYNHRPDRSSVRCFSMIEHYSILAALMLGDIFWWRMAARSLEPGRGASVARWVLAAFVGLQLAYLGWLVIDDLFDALPMVRPLAIPIVGYIWHILVLPVVCLISLASRFVKRIRRRKVVDSPSDFPGQCSRRQVLRGAMTIAAPPLVAAVASVAGISQVGRFRTRDVTLSLSQLPADLDGLTIAHVTDLHFGRFVPAELAGPIADAVNAMDCDVIALTGDLLDGSAPKLDPGIDFLKRLRPRHGMAIIEGNHDVMRTTEHFEGAMKDQGFPLLLDEQMTLRLPGRKTALQLLGITWGRLETGEEQHVYGKNRYRHFRRTTDPDRASSVERVAAMRRADAFPILLAHHPHAFDPAAGLGFPLVLSGHTHGGQLMLTHDIGGGPMRFRYWSGLYKKPGSQLFISNGVGAWFPLRVNAPAEIVRLTLRSGPGVA